MSNSIVRKFVLSWKRLLLFASVIVFVAGVQFGIAAVIKESTVLAANVSCSVKSIDTDDGTTLVATLDCNGSQERTKDVRFIAGYIMNPKPFTCTLYSGGGYARCTVQRP